MKVAPLALGTVKLGRNTDVKYPEGFDLPTDRAVRELLAEAQRLGVNLLDTAPAYGSSEERLGRLLPGRREDWLLCTKTGETYGRKGSAHDYSRKATLASVHASLRRLQTDYLDLVLVHSNGEDRRIIEETEVLAALADLKRQGSIRAYGFSGKRPEETRLALPQVDVLMLPLSQADQSHLPLVAEAAAQGKGLLLKKIFDSGHAADPSAAIRFALGQPGVSAAVIGTVNPAHLAQNIAAALA